MNSSQQRSELSDLMEGQRRLEEQLRDLKELLQCMLAARGAECYEAPDEPQPHTETDQPPGSEGREEAGQLESSERPGDPYPLERKVRRASTSDLTKQIMHNHFSSAQIVRKNSGKCACGQRLSSKAQMIVGSQKFDYAMGIIIIVNTITLGVEIEFSLEGKSLAVLQALEYLFLAIFFSEIILALMAFGRANLKKAWFYLDSALVLTGILGVFLPKITEPSAEEEDNSVIGFLGSIQLFRILRLLRLLRTLRSIEQFTELWTITIGLIRCFKTVMSAMVLVFVTIYFFSCLAVELIFKSSLLRSDPETGPLVNTHFDSLPKAMLTLIAFANADSIAGIYAPLCAVQPWLGLFFFSLWLILTISLLNMVAAVIVEKSLAHANEDLELRQRSMRKLLSSLVPQIRHVFRQMDADDTGTLCLDELDFDSVEVPNELRPIMMGDKLKDLFEQIDLDHSGDVDEQEFIHGICHLALSGVPIETTQIIQLLKRQDKQLSMLEEHMATLSRYTRKPIPKTAPAAQPEEVAQSAEAASSSAVALVGRTDRATEDDVRNG